MRKCLHFNFQCVHWLANVHRRSGAQGSGHKVNGNVFLSHAVLVFWCQNIALVDVKLSGKLLMCRTTISHLNSSCGICLCFIRVMYRGRGRLLLALSRTWRHSDDISETKYANMFSISQQIMQRMKFAAHRQLSFYCIY